MKSEIFKAVQYLRSGGVILYPCDTIWAMGCDATNQDAINKIYNFRYVFGNLLINLLQTAQISGLTL